MKPIATLRKALGTSCWEDTHKRDPELTETGIEFPCTEFGPSLAWEFPKISQWGAFITMTPAKETPNLKKQPHTPLQGVLALAQGRF